MFLRSQKLSSFSIKIIKDKNGNQDYKDNGLAIADGVVKLEVSPFGLNMSEWNVKECFLIIF